MKSITTYITEKLRLNDPGNYNYFPTTAEELDDIIAQLIEERGNNADLNDIDTSQITNMSFVFSLNETINFNGDISKWDVSNVEDMQGLFLGNTAFDGDLSKWDVSNVKNMNSMFEKSKFTGKNADISDWNVSNVIKARSMFRSSPFDGNLSKWKLNNRCNTRIMFHNCPLKEQPQKWPENYNPN